MIVKFALRHANRDTADRAALHHPRQELAADIGQHGVGQDGVDQAAAAGHFIAARDDQIVNESDRAQMLSGTALEFLNRKAEEFR